MAEPIQPPTLGLGVDDLVDWLELTALFHEFGVARVDALLGALEGLEECAEDDIGERDRQREVTIDKIENEFDLRCTHLGEAYPFRLSDGGEELSIDANWRDEKYSFYLICLVTTHVTGSLVLAHPPVGDLLTRLRNRVFQIVATLGVAGLSVGPAFSVGWPRNRGEPIIELLRRASAAGGGFNVRDEAGPYTSDDEKDGGVDVISWTADALPPPPMFYYGQTASGKNWPGKPVESHARVFQTAYMIDQMAGNLSYVTLIPYRVVDTKFWHSQSLLHRAILDRLRLPLRAWQGLQLAGRGVLIDGSEHVADVTDWLNDYLGYAQAA